MVAPAPALEAPRKPSHPAWPWIAAAGVACLAAAATSFMAYRATRPIEHSLIRVSDQLETGIYLDGSMGPAIAVSLDGSHLAYVTVDAAQVTHLATRRLDAAKSIVLAGTDGADAPFFSPDGRWIAFFVFDERRTTLKKISIEGGAAVTICQVPTGVRGGGFWSDDDTIFFAGVSTPVLRVAAAGGTPTPVTQLEAATGNLQPSHRAAQLLPGGDAILFEISKDRQTWEDATIEVQSLKSGQRTMLVQGRYFGKYIAGPNGSTGHLIYMHGDTLFAMALASLSCLSPESTCRLPVFPRMENDSRIGS